MVMGVKMKKNELHPIDRLNYQLNKLEKNPVNEICTFTSKNRNLYTRLHTYRKDNKISETIRELIDLGLKVKGY